MSPVKKQTRKKKPLRIALGVFPIQSDPDRNFSTIRDLTRKAASRKARIILFAEGALSGYFGEQFHVASEVDTDRVHELNRALGGLAKEFKIYIVAGSLVREETAYSNTLLAFSPSGRRVARYDKRHRTGRDVGFYRQGTTPSLFRVDGWKVGLLLCFDARFPIWSHEYVRRGANLLLYSFNMCGKRGLWKRPVMEGTLRTRAAENDVFVAAVNDGRPHSHVPAIAVDRGGCTIARAFPRSPSIVVADLDPSRTYPIEREIVRDIPLDYEVAASWKRRK